jgi:hypothetical protein
MYLCGMGDKKTNRRFYNGKKYGVSDNSIRKWIKYYDKQLVLLEK